jgi:DNA-binding transcriptional LysR family regulator
MSAFDSPADVLRDCYRGDGPAATSPFFMNESLEGARIALRCDNPLIQLQAASNSIGIAELACFLGDACADLVRIWPDEPPRPTRQTVRTTFAF